MSIGQKRRCQLATKEGVNWPQEKVSIRHNRRCQFATIEGVNWPQEKVSIGQKRRCQLATKEGVNWPQEKVSIRHKRRCQFATREGVNSPHSLPRKESLLFIISITVWSENIFLMHKHTPTRTTRDAEVPPAILIYIYSSLVGHETV